MTSVRVILGAGGGAEKHPCLPSLCIVCIGLYIDLRSSTFSKHVYNIYRLSYIGGYGGKKRIKTTLTTGGIYIVGHTLFMTKVRLQSL